MLVADWSTLDGRDCIRITGGGEPEVRVEGAPEGFPAVAGRLVRDGSAWCFLPRYPFAAGVGYLVVGADGRSSQTLRRTSTEPTPSTTVTRILPTAEVVPRNLLRVAIEFSAPMGAGGAAAAIRLVADDGPDLTDSLLQSHDELWDGGRTRLTVLLDPGRIKQGLARHEHDGYPLAADGTFRVVVHPTMMRDAGGAHLLRGAERRYRIVDPWTDRVDPGGWTMRRPAAGSVDPLEVAFDRSLDHALLQRCLRILAPDGPPIAGRAEIGVEERSWRFVPAQPWRRGSHVVAIDGSLEDLAGNSVARPFDRDLTAPEADPLVGPVVLRFEPT